MRLKKVKKNAAGNHITKKLKTGYTEGLKLVNADIIMSKRIIKKIIPVETIPPNDKIKYLFSMSSSRVGYMSHEPARPLFESIVIVGLFSL